MSSYPAIPIRSDRIQHDLEALAAITDPGAPWTRQGFTPLDAQARQWFQDQVAGLGMTVRTDAAANVFAHREGTEPGLRPIWTGSHLDTVASGGRFDGVTGVVAGLEVVRAFAEADVAMRHPLDLVVFTCEEASVLGLTPFGSRAIAGLLAIERVAEVCAPHGIPLPAALRELGGDPDRLADARLEPSGVHALWELHIEQGPELEERGIAAGAVSAIAAPSRGRVTAIGRADHAGATAMDRRNDALTAAAEIILAVEGAARAIPEAVGTVGQIVAAPNQVAVVPARVEFSVEIRAATREAIEAARNAVEAAVRKVERNRPVQIDLDWLVTELPVIIPEPLVRVVEQSAEDLGITCCRIVSRASHDSARLASLMPVGMVFVPSKDGRSHCPEEWSDYEAIADGARLLAQAILRTDEMDDISG